MSATRPGSPTGQEVEAGRPSIVWLRDDLRLADNPALTAAAKHGRPVIVVYVRDEESLGVRPLGAASRWWLHGSLDALAQSLAQLGGSLVLRSGAAETVIPALVTETDAAAVYWNRRYGAAREIDARLKTRLRGDGIEAHSFSATVLHEPWTVTTGDGNPYRVFTPYWRACLDLPVREVLPVPANAAWATVPSESLSDWRLLPRDPDWAAGLRAAWTPGEAGASNQFESFVAERLENYHRRDEPAVAATSRLSPHLRFGEIGPVQLWHRLRGAATVDAAGPREALPEAAARNVAKFLSEVGWREFSINILFHNPELAQRNYRPAFDGFSWGEPDPAEVAAWRHGRTGIPLVDAGMRELWTTGYLHNRVRMVVASFLTKNLLVDWRVGEQWFWDTLVDADEANNPASWQWVAGSGADAAPYFRVFNPLLQAAKFDPDGEYVRRWVPELHSASYPPPIVDLAETRARALAAYAALKP